MLVMNGSDHLPPQPELPSMLRDLPTTRWRTPSSSTSRCPRVFERVREHMGERADEWPTHIGEFRSGQRAHLLPGVLSARIWIKQPNQAVRGPARALGGALLAWADASSRCRPGVERAAAADERPHAVPDVRATRSPR